MPQQILHLNRGLPLPTFCLSIFSPVQKEVSFSCFPSFSLQLVSPTSFSPSDWFLEIFIH